MATLFANASRATADRANAREFARIGTVLAESGAPKEALRFFQQAIESDPDFAEVYELALPLWFETKQEARATAELERLTLRCPHCTFAWYALGALYRRAERYDLAILAYEAFLARRPKDPDAVFGYAMALVATKDDRAGVALERYVALESRPERMAYREQALRLIRAREAAKPNVDRLLRYLVPLRAWVLVFWPASDAGDDEAHGL